MIGPTNFDQNKKTEKLEVFLFVFANVSDALTFTKNIKFQGFLIIRSRELGEHITSTTCLIILSLI